MAPAGARASRDRRRRLAEVAEPVDRAACCAPSSAASAPPSTPCAICCSRSATACLREVYGDLLKGVAEEYARLYDNHRHTMHVLRDAGLPIPEPLKQAAESVLGSRFEAEIARQRRSRDPGALSPRRQDGRGRARARPDLAACGRAAGVRRDAVGPVGRAAARAGARADPRGHRRSSTSAGSSASSRCRRARRSSCGSCWRRRRSGRRELEALAEELGFAPPSLADAAPGRRRRRPMRATRRTRSIRHATRTRPAPRAA